MNDSMRQVLDLVNEMSEEGTIEVEDSFDIELGDDLLIETGVVAINEDGILVEGDEETLKLLAEHGLILEETDWSKYDEPTVSRIAKGITKPVDSTDYNVPPAMRDPMQGKPGYEKRRSNIMKGLGKVEPKDFTEDSYDLDEQGDKNLNIKALRRKFNQNENDNLHTENALMLAQAFGDNEEINTMNKALRYLHSRGGYNSQDPTANRYLSYVAKIHEKYYPYLYGKQGMAEGEVVKGPWAGSSTSVEKVPTGFTVHHPKLIYLYYNPKTQEVYNTVSGEQHKDYGNEFYWHRSGGQYEWPEGPKTKVSADDMRDFLSKTNFRVSVDDDDDLREAKYQGREVPLGKPMAGDVKKSKVYVRGPKGNVVKVNFGDKKMRIKKSNPKRRKSFRARHNCKNPGPRWKARYWSCRAW